MDHCERVVTALYPVLQLNVSSEMNPTRLYKIIQDEKYLQSPSNLQESGDVFYTSFPIDAARPNPFFPEINL